MKIWAHITVWVVIFIVETLVYWAGRFWIIETFQEAFVYNLVINVPKVIGTYLLLYMIKAFRSSLDERSVSSWTIIIVYIVLWLVIYRLILNFISWPIAFGVYPRYEPFSIPLNSFSFFKLITPFLVIFFLQTLSDRNSSNQRVKALEKSRLETELKYLRSQFNPHFLFNTLNNIYVLAREKSDLTAPSIAGLSHMLRTMLYETTEDLITLEKELELIDHYIKLEQLRYGDRLTCTVNNSIAESERKIPAFLFLNFVENAFKHSSASSSEQIEIRVDIEQMGNKLDFKCTNPAPQESSLEKKGIGLTNTRRRLELYFPRRHRLEKGIECARYKIGLTLLWDEA